MYFNLGMGVYVQSFREIGKTGFYQPTQVRYDEDEVKDAMREEEWALSIPKDRIIIPPL